MRVAFYRNSYDTEAELQNVEWADIVAKLERSRVSPRSLCSTWPCNGRSPNGRPCPGKNGPAWSPVELEGKRANDNVRAVTVAVFDLDHVTDEVSVGVIDRLEARGLAFVLHSTHRHNPAEVPDANELRLVMPMTRPVAPKEWASVRAAIIAELQIPADPATGDLSRIFFLPNSVEGTEPLFYASEGKSLDVDEIARMRPASALQQRLLSHTEAPEPAAGDPIDLNDLASTIRKHASEANRPLVTRTLRGEGLGPRGNANEHGGQDRALQLVMSTAAFCAPDETPWEAIEHLFRPCFVATDWGEGTEHLIGQARDKFDRARERKAKRDAERKAENDAIWAAAGIAREAVTKAAPSPLDEAETEDPDAWVKGLVYTRDKEPKLAICEQNVRLVLCNANEWREAIRFNEVSKQFELTHAPEGIRSVDALDVRISMWFQSSPWGRLGLQPTPRMVGEVLRALPELVGYDPLRQYLEKIQWDGKPRIDSFLERYFGADVGPEGDDPAYVRQISRRWLISLVARGLRPGEKVDTVLCLEGQQGLMKSTALRTITSPWFCDSKIDVRSKDSWALAAQFWLLELAEAEGMSKAQAEELKGFFSKRDDTYRPPYGRTNTTTLRRALFAVTTNASRYLKFDPTGYRRYWPVACSKIDLEALRADRDQLLAEAVTAFRSGEIWYFVRGTPEADLVETAARRRAESVGEASVEIISEWFCAMAPDKRPRNVKVHELLSNPDVFGLQRHQITGGREKDLIDVLREMGFERYNSARGKAWKTPAHLLESAQVQPLRPGVAAPLPSPAARTS